MREDECVRLNIPIQPLDHTDTNVPAQADGKSLLEIVGKTKFSAVRGKATFYWEGYVCKNLHSAILCGGAFMERNNVVQELSKKRIVVDNKYFILETSPLCPDPLPDTHVAYSEFQTKQTKTDEKDLRLDAKDTIFKIEIGAGVSKRNREKPP